MTALPLTPSPAHSISAPALRLTTQAASPKPQADPSPPPQAAQWIPIATAAPILDTSEGALRARCTRELAPRSLARLLPSASGRNSWHLHVSIDPRLLRAHSPSALARVAGERSAYEAATDRQKSAARLKAQVVIRFRAWREQRGINTLADFPAFASMMLAELGIAVSRTSVYDWNTRAGTSGGGVGDVESIAAALIDRRGGDRSDGSSAEPSPDAWLLFERLYLDPRQLSMSKCWRTVADLAPVNAWTWPSLDTIARRAARLLPPRVRDLARLGGEAFSKTHITPCEQDPDAWQPGECWESDHSNFDCFIRVFRGNKWVAARPWLTAWMDRRSRCLMGWHVSFDHNATTIRLALMHAIRASGYSVPHHVWLDNGKDFQSMQLHGIARAAAAGRRERKSQAADLSPSHTPAERAAQIGLLGMLGITTHFAVPYNHNGKARIERMFGTMRADFDRTFASWCGSKPGERDKESLDAVLADVESLPTLEEFSERFAAWAQRYNTTTDHAVEDLDGLSRLDFYTRHLPARRSASESSLRELEKDVEQPRVVTKRGVRLKIGTRTYHYGGGHPALADLVGTETRVWLTYDPSDLSAVNVWTEAGVLLCSAERNRQHGGVMTPVSRASLKDAQALQRRQEREARRASPIDSMLLTDIERAALAESDQRAARESKRIAAAAEPVPMRLVPTIIDQDAARAGMPAPSAEPDDPDLQGVSLADIVADIGAAMRSGGGGFMGERHAPRGDDQADELSGMLSASELAAAMEERS